MNRFRGILPTLVCVLVAIAAASAGAQHEVQKLQASDKANDDTYGISVDVDEWVAVVGSLAADNGGKDQGAAYVYRHDGTQWLEEQKLIAADPQDFATFGEAVAVSGDTVVVGAPDAAGGGAAYIFEFDGTTWSQSAKLTSPASQNKNVGEAVAIDGDTVVVGDPDNYYAGRTTGLVLVYEKPPGGWQDTSNAALLTTTTLSASDFLGTWVAIDGDDIVAGAPGEDIGGGSGEGAAYVYEKPPGGWMDMTETATLTVATPQGGEGLGASVSIEGGVVVAGANKWDGAGVSHGAVYVFDRPAGGWVSVNETQMLVASDGYANDYFGGAVAVMGSTLVVGSAGCNAVGPDSGAVYLFQYDGTSWQETAKLLTSDLGGYNGLGTSVALSHTTAFFGAPGHDSPGRNTGAAYMFETEAFQLASSPAQATIGDVVTVHVCRGEPGAVVGLLTLAVDGVPLIVWLDIATFDALGTYELSGVVPVTGFNVTLMAFGRSAATGRVRGTNPFTIDLVP